MVVGTNTVTVTVTAPDGKTKKNYYIYVARQASRDDEIIPNVIEEPTGTENPTDENEEKEELGLLSIAIDDKYEIYLEPEFKTNVYEYKINLKEDLSSIPLTAIPNKEGAEVKITGNEDLKEGENAIRIAITDPETEQTVTYTILVNKEIETQENEEEVLPASEETLKDKIIKIIKENWIIIAVLCICIVALISTIVIINKRKDSRFFEEYTRTNRDNDTLENNIDEENNNENNEENDKEENFDSSDEQNEVVQEERIRRRSRGKGKHF